MVVAVHAQRTTAQLLSCLQGLVSACWQPAQPWPDKDLLTVRVAFVLLQPLLLTQAVNSTNLAALPQLLGPVALTPLAR